MKINRVVSITLFVPVFFAALYFIFAKTDSKEEPCDYLLSFINSKKYSVYNAKNEIPSAVKDSLIFYYKGNFNIGDYQDSTNINLTDFRIENELMYDKKLHFIAKNSSECLISYSVGGFASYNVIEYFSRLKKNQHIRFESTQELSDIPTVLKFLSTKPAPVYIYPPVRD
jgi:hypothetical protein